MNQQEEKIRQLYKDGVLTKEEMESELKKERFSEQKTHKLSKLWWIIGAVFAVAIGITSVTMLNSSSGEVPKWSKTEIKGFPAVQTNLHSDEYGVLNVAYSPEIGLRIGVFNNDHSSEYKEGMMLGYIIKGEEFAMLLIPDESDNNYMYFKGSKLIEILNSGDVEWLTIERVNDDFTKDDSVDYRWPVILKSGAFADAINDL